MTIDDELLAAAKLAAARSHRTIGSVLEDALCKLLADDEPGADVTLPDFHYDGGLRPGVDLYDKDALADLLDHDGGSALS